MRPDSEIRDAIEGLTLLRETMRGKGFQRETMHITNNIRLLVWAIGDESAPGYVDTDKFLKRLMET